MKYPALAIGIFLLSASLARAGLPAADLQEIGVSPAPGARIPTEFRWNDESGLPVTLGKAMAGRPTVLVFADYTCSTLCGPVLTFVLDALEQSGLPPHDYRLVVLGLDPRDGPREAASMKKARISADMVALAPIFLTADEAVIRQATQAVGYRFTYDAAHDQFAHPAAVLVLTGDGRVTRVLSGLGISANDFRLALVEAGQGRIGTLGDQVRLLCYGFDPSTGIYTVSIYRALAIASAVTILLLAAAIGWLSLRRPRLS
jgi:protein SCO1/2